MQAEKEEFKHESSNDLIDNITGNHSDDSLVPSCVTYLLKCQNDETCHSDNDSTSSECSDEIQEEDANIGISPSDKFNVEKKTEN